MIPPRFRLVVASQTSLKQEAVRRALRELHMTADVVGIATNSAVAEQPFGREAVAGAFYRLQHAGALDPEADYHVAIENGLFEEDGRYIDRAVVAGAGHGMMGFILSEGVEIPAPYVAAAQASGWRQRYAAFMLRDGLITDVQDPHRSLPLFENVGLRMPRERILRRALVKLFVMHPPTGLGR